MHFLSLAPAAILAVTAYTVTVPANAQDSRGDHDRTYQCVTGYRDVPGVNALPFYKALAISGMYAGKPLAEIRVAHDEVVISAHADSRFRTVRVGRRQISVTTTDVPGKTQVTTILENGQVSATSQDWSPINGPVGTTSPSQPLRPDEVKSLADRALRAIDNLCGPSFTN